MDKSTPCMICTRNIAKYQCARCSLLICANCRGTNGFCVHCAKSR